MTKRIFALILALLMTCALFTACKEKEAAEEVSIVGAWKNNDNDMQLIYVFDSDGTGLVASEAEALAFKWSTEGNILRLTIKESTSESNFILTEDTLTISNDKETVIYKKVK